MNNREESEAKFVANSIYLFLFTSFCYLFLENYQVFLLLSFLAVPLSMICPSSLLYNRKESAIIFLIDLFEVERNVIILIVF